jgi:phenylacetaldehyde dehydrogenase
VCGQIISWNGPLSTGSWKVAPALAFGNTIILKPAEQIPLPALRLGELILEAGLPEGVVNIVTGFGSTAGAAITAHPDIGKVAFTGSTEVGKLILQASAGNLKRVSLELGGKSPNLIFPDADLERAAAVSAGGIFRNQGQVCCAASRVLVQEGIYDEFAERIAQRAAEIKLGQPLDPATTMGPLVSKEQHERVLGYLGVAGIGLRQAVRAQSRRLRTVHKENAKWQQQYQPSKGSARVSRRPPRWNFSRAH